jgi:hypothetical protein
MSSILRRILLALLPLVALTDPACARPLHADAGGYGVVEWDSLVALQNAEQARREHGYHFGPLLGATYLRVGDAEFSPPIYGGSVRKDAYTLFLGGGGRIGGNDRVRFAGVRFGLPPGLFFQVSVVDAWQVVSDLDAYSHRATGATGSVGYEWLGGPFHGSLSCGAGGFDLVTPKQEESETAFGFQLSGHAGFTF